MEESGHEVEGIICEESEEALSKLPNIGKVLEDQLRQAGITNAGMLRKMGSQQAWLKIRENDSTACLHRLYALEGAVQGIKKALLTNEKKEELRAFFQSATQER